MPHFRFARLSLATLCAALTATLAACAVEGDAPTSSDPEPSAASSPSAPSAPVSSHAPAVARAEQDIANLHDRIFADARHSFYARDVVVDADGTEHVRFDRKYLGLDVIGGDFVMHRDPNGNHEISQTIAGKIDIGVVAKIGVAEAKDAALASLGDVSDKKVGSAKLVIDASNGPAVLAYEIIIDGTRTIVEQGETPTKMHVLVDAKLGHVIDSWDGVETVAGTGNGFFVGEVPLTVDVSGASFVLKDPSRGNMATYDLGGSKGGSGTLIKSATTTFGNGLLSNPASTGVDAQYGTAVTFDYYLTVHGRNGIGNDGLGASNKVHYGRKYNNAFWSDSCFCMTYGDGDGTTFLPFDSLDVAGHEMSHGVTSRSANLAYRGESGGLNEATSDIFGTAVEFFANNAKDTPDYDIGEKLYVSGTKALRYMYKPSKDGASADCWYTNVGKLDVHYSSGIANHFFYLLAEGTAPASGPASPTCKATDTRVATGTDALTGIGRAAAEKIWYRALTVYMGSTTNYAGARLATIKAANDLDATGAQAAAVAATWTALNVK